MKTKTKRTNHKRSNRHLEPLVRRQPDTKWDGLDPYIVSTGTMKKAHIRALNAKDAAVRAIMKHKPQNIGMLVEIKREGGITVWWDSREALRVAGLSA
jgi:hypothetical protein